jgi:hypothetical protein
MQIVGYRLNTKGAGSIPSRGKRFSLLHCFQTASEVTQPTIQWVVDSDHSDSVSRLRMCGVILPLPHSLQTQCLVRHRAFSPCIVCTFETAGFDSWEGKEIFLFCAVPILTGV